MSEAIFWLLATLFWTFFMSFYSTQEMAAISFNKLRLEYYVSQNEKWAICLHKLLANPTKLFSTTLIGVNVCLMASSESSRELYRSLGINPNLAPLTQIPFILLFGELIPMFAARIYSEHMARLGAPLLYLSATILSPFSTVVNLFFKRISKLFGGGVEAGAAILTREELQTLIEESELPKSAPREKHINAIIQNIFLLRSQVATQLMDPLSAQLPCVSTLTTIASLKAVIKDVDASFIPVYHRSSNKIIGILLPQDLLDAPDSKKVREFMKPVPFVSEYSTGLQLLYQLQKEELPVAVVLNQEGVALGIVTIDSILEEIYSKHEESPNITYLEKTIAAKTKIQDINEAYNIHIDSQGCQTFEELIEVILGRHPAVNDAIFIDPVEIVVKETSLFKAKTILLKTHPSS